MIKKNTLIPYKRTLTLPLNPLCIRLAMHLFLCTFLFSSCTSNPVTITPSSTPYLSVTSPASTLPHASSFLPGITNADTSLFDPWNGNDSQAVVRAKKLIGQGLSFFNVQIMGWGADDPWPDPHKPEPDNWSTLDTKLTIATQTHTTPVLTLCEAPWWMKGVLQSNGQTRLLTTADDFAPVAYQSRVLDNKMDSWLHLVRRVAERYMLPPYNVRYFQVWNELKGYYNPQIDNWDMSTSPGNPSASNATHGYTYMYNRVYDTLRTVAQTHKIDPASLSIGGPYVTMSTWSSNQQSHPSRLVKAYGTYDQRSLDAVTYWLQHKNGAQFIAIDGSNQNDDNIPISDAFIAAEKFADVVTWIRSLNPTLYPGATTLPIWWSEWYADPYDHITNNDYTNAIKTYAIIKLIKAGSASVTLSWNADNLWTPTTNNGAQPLPWYTSYQIFKRYFSPGTLLYPSLSSSSQVETLANSQVTLLVNKTSLTLSVSFPHTKVQLHPYQVLLLHNSSI